MQLTSQDLQIMNTNSQSSHYFTCQETFRFIYYHPHKIKCLTRDLISDLGWSSSKISQFTQFHTNRQSYAPFVIHTSQYSIGIWHYVLPPTFKFMISSVIYQVCDSSNNITENDHQMHSLSITESPLFNKRPSHKQCLHR